MQEFGEFHSADARDDLGQQHVAAVRVGPFGAGHEIQGALAQDHAHRVGVAARPVEERHPVANAAGMRQQMIDGDRVPEVGQRRDVLADIVGQRQFPILDERENGHGDELLSDRAGVQERVRGERDVAFEVSQPIRAIDGQLPIVRSGRDAPGHTRFDPTENLVDLGSPVLRHARRRKKKDGGEPQQDGSISNVRFHTIVHTADDRHSNRRSRQRSVSNV